MKKNIVLALLTLTITIIIIGYVGISKFNSALFDSKPNLFSFTFELKPIHFQWANSTKGDLTESQTALLIPITLKDFEHKFYMQYDTGSPYSFIYEHQLQSLQSLGLEIDKIEIDGSQYVKKLEMILGGNQMSFSMLKIYENYGSKFTMADTSKKISIGTLGSDMLIDRITSIDFKNQEITITKERPNWTKSNLKFSPFSFAGRRILLPAKVDNKTYNYLYDSGCSAFGLITTKSRYEKYTDAESKEIIYDAKSWENSLKITSKNTPKRFNIGNTSLGLERVSYVDMYTSLQPLITPFTRIGGWLGNRPFVDCTLILDTKNEEFAVIKSDQ